MGFRAGNPGAGGKSEGPAGNRGADRGGREIEGAGAKSSGKTTQSLQNRERIEREREEREGLREADELAAPGRILGDGDPCATAHLRLSARPLPRAALPRATSAGRRPRLLNAAVRPGLLCTSSAGQRQLVRGLVRPFARVQWPGNSSAVSPSPPLCFTALACSAARAGSAACFAASAGSAACSAFCL